MAETETLECLDAHQGGCEGEVEYRTLDGIKSWPRCVAHFDKRLDKFENSIERYANSDVAPDWFDPADAGERWEEDY